MVLANPTYMYACMWPTSCVLRDFCTSPICTQARKAVDVINSVMGHLGECAFHSHASFQPYDYQMNVTHSDMFRLGFW